MKDLNDRIKKLLANSIRKRDKYIITKYKSYFKTEFKEIPDVMDLDQTVHYITFNSKKYILKDDLLNDIINSYLRNHAVFNEKDCYNWTYEKYTELLNHYKENLYNNTNSLFLNFIEETQNFLVFESVDNSLFQKIDNDLPLNISKLKEISKQFRIKNPFSTTEVISPFYNFIKSFTDNDYSINILTKQLKFLNIWKFEKHPNDGFFVFNRELKTLYIFDIRENVDIETIYNTYFKELDYDYLKNDGISFQEITIEYVEKNITDKIYDIFAI